MRRALHYAFFLLTGISWCQSPPDATLGAALHSLASRAGIVFVGQVIKIEPKPGVVEVTFRVDRPIQGAVGGTYTLREWAGLWANGQPRYTLGQRAMVFLHAPGVSGLSTPVDGMDGIVPVLPSTADAASMLDARWLATRLQRNPGAPLLAATVSLNDAVSAVQFASEPRLFSSPLQPKPVPVLPVRILPRGGGYIADPLSARPPVQVAPQILLQAMPNVY